MKKYKKPKTFIIEVKYADLKVRYESFVLYKLRIDKVLYTFLVGIMFFPIFIIILYERGFIYFDFYEYETDSFDTLNGAKINIDKILKKHKEDFFKEHNLELSKTILSTKKIKYS